MVLGCGRPQFRRVFKMARGTKFMISDVPINLVRIRPHHIAPFAEYWRKGKLVLDGSRPHAPEFANALLRLYDSIIKDRDSMAIMIVDGSGGDSICDLCDTKSTCQTRNNPDNMSVWNGSGIVMQNCEFEFGRAYSSGEFRDGVRRAYPHVLPTEQN